MQAALIVLIVLAVVGLFFLGRWLKKRREQALEAAAAQLGLEFSEHDTRRMIDLPFQLLREGEGRGCENLMWGAWRGLPLTEFDYWYYTEYTDKNGTHRDYKYFSCSVTDLPIQGSHLTISHETLLTRMADHMGLEDIQFESEEFNRAFNVKCKDQKFATDIVDARMMQWLLGEGKGWSFELSGPHLMCYTRPRKPSDLIPLLGTLKAFHDNIPRVVYGLYGSGPSGTVQQEGS